MPGDDYTSKRLTIAQKGINYELEPTLMKGMFSPYVKNMMFEKGGIKKFLGYSSVGGNPNLKSIGGSEIGCALREFIDFTGSHLMLAFTDDTAFLGDERSSSSFTWKNINPGAYVDACNSGWTDAHAKMTVAHDSAQKIEGNSLKITADEAFSDADKICYKNFSSADLTGYTHICGWVRTNFSSPGESLKLVISESADGAKAGDYVTAEIRIDDISANEWRFFCEAVDLSAMNAAVSVGVWNDASISWINQSVWIAHVRAITLLNHSINAAYGICYDFADATDVEEFTTSEDGRAVIVSPGNETDGLLYWENALTSINPLKTLVHGITNFDFAHCIIEFWNHFFIGGYQGDNSAGNRHFESVGHAAMGDVDDWISDGSGFYHLSDTRGRVLRMTKNDYMMNIYSTDSISRGLWYGSYILFAFPCIMDRLGLIAHGAVNAGEHADYFIGSDRRFYSMPIGQKPVSIGDQIARQVFKDEFVSRSYKHYTVCGKFDFKDRILFCIPDVSTTNNFPTKIYVYDIINKRWEYFVFAHEIRAFAYSGYLESTLFMEKNCIVYELDEPATGLMGASEIACEYQTEDVTIDEEHSNARWKWFTFTAKSSIASKTVVVQYSTDNGSTWTAFDDSPISLTSSWVTHRIPLDVVSRVIRFRFTQTSGDLQIKANMFYGFSPDTEE